MTSKILASFGTSSDMTGYLVKRLYVWSAFARVSTTARASKFTNSHKNVFYPSERHSLGTSRAVLLGNVDQEVTDTPRVAPLVVVPGDQLHKVLVQLNTGLCVKDGGSRVANEI